jgi:hypothetical protein
MDYLGLNEFIEKVSFGELGPGVPIEVRNMGGDRIQRISFINHCDILCQKHMLDLNKSIITSDFLFWYYVLITLFIIILNKISNMDNQNENPEQQ